MSNLIFLHGDTRVLSGFNGSQIHPGAPGSPPMGLLRLLRLGHPLEEYWSVIFYDDKIFDDVVVESQIQYQGGVRPALTFLGQFLLACVENEVEFHAWYGGNVQGLTEVQNSTEL